MDERVDDEGTAEAGAPERPALPREDEPEERAAVADRAAVGRRSANLDAVIWAAALIWAGGVLLAENLGYLHWFAPGTSGSIWGLPYRGAVWTLIFLGVAALIGVEILLRLVLPAYRRNVLGYVILMIVFVGLGLGRIGVIWPLILIVLGVTLLVWRRRRR